MEEIKEIKEIKEINQKWIDQILDNLAIDRPIFHNEQDFQFELAREISKHINNEDIKVRLEYCIGESEKDKNEDIENKEKSKDKKNRIYVDIMIIEKINNKKYNAIAIELKYKTKASNGNYEDEIFDLKDQGADDWGCYYIYNDIRRIEKLVYRKEEKGDKYYNLENMNVIKGYVIFLTNNERKYNADRKGIFKNYNLKEKNKNVIIKKGPIYYCNKENPYEDNEKANYKSIKGKPVITFDEKHEGQWSTYSNLQNRENSNLKDEIKQLVFEIEK